MKPSPEALEAFVAGQLSEEESATLIARLVEDDEALEQVDLLWQDEFGLEGPPGREPPDSSQIESRFFNRVRRSDLGGRAVWLGTQGLFSVFMAFLQPLLGGKKLQRERNRSAGW